MAAKRATPSRMGITIVRPRNHATRSPADIGSPRRCLRRAFSSVTNRAGRRRRTGGRPGLAPRGRSPWPRRSPRSGSSSPQSSRAGRASRGRCGIPRSDRRVSAPVPGMAQPAFRGAAVVRRTAVAAGQLGFWVGAPVDHVMPPTGLDGTGSRAAAPAADCRRAYSVASDFTRRITWPWMIPLIASAVKNISS